MPNSFRITVDDRVSPYMASILGRMDSSVADAFRNEEDPVTGEPWEELSEAYLARREAAGRTGRGPGVGGYRLLQITGDLATPVPSYGDDYAELAFDEVYSAIHQYGGTSDMPPGPAAIPARPFAGLSDDAASDVLQLIATYVADGKR